MPSPHQLPGHGDAPEMSQGWGRGCILLGLGPQPRAPGHSSGKVAFKRKTALCPTQPPPGRGRPAVSLDDGAFLHVEPHPVLALGPVTLPVRVSMAVGQTRHIEVFLEEGSEQKGGSDRGRINFP